jgi:NAD(P)-dependent dehydrogenase (short-subunit alcohol dehydrogenase family)
MGRIFITGSADGLGQLAAKALIAAGHHVVLHARNEERGQEALDKTPGAEAVVTGDLTNTDETKKLASKVNTFGVFDAVIHNAGVYNAPANQIFSVNTIAPYILTCLMRKPKRLIYLSSDMHQGGRSKLDSFKNDFKQITYSDSKLHVLMLAKAVARKWPDIYSNAINPGWVPTKMGGAGAPDSLESGYQTQVWLAVSSDEKAKVSGRYFYHKKEIPFNPEADNITLQDRFLNLCKEITGVSFPANGT